MTADYKNEKQLILSKARAVMSKGFVESQRKGDTGIGKTFEELMKIRENNDPGCDLHGYEIKSQRIHSSSYITLFTKSPSHPKSVNTFLKERFGTPYDENPDLKKLHTSMFADSYNTYMDTYSFRLIHKPNEEKIYIGVYNIDTKNLIDSTAYYTYSDIANKLETKLKQLFLILAEAKKIGSKEYFKYEKIYLCYKPSLQRFLKLLDDGKIMFDIRIGSYKSGKRKGRPHDHGSGFRIKRDNLPLLYDEVSEP